MSSDRSDLSLRLIPERSLVSRLFHKPDETIVRDLMSRGATREEAKRAAKAMKTREGAESWLAAHRELCDLTHPCESPDQCWEIHGRRRRAPTASSSSNPSSGSNSAAGSSRLNEKDAAVLWLSSHGFSERTAASALSFCAGDKHAALAALQHTKHTRVDPNCEHCISHPPAQDLDAGPYAGANHPNAANAVMDEPAPPPVGEEDELPQYTSAREYDRQRRREMREEERIDALIRQHHQRGKRNRENWGRTCPSSQIVAARARLMFNPRARWDDLLY